MVDKEDVGGKEIWRYSGFRLPKELGQALEIKCAMRGRLPLTQAIQEAVGLWVDEGRAEGLSQPLQKYQNAFESIAAKLETFPAENREKMATLLVEFLTSTGAILAGMPDADRQRTVHSMRAVAKANLEMYREYSESEGNPKKKKRNG